MPQFHHREETPTGIKIGWDQVFDIPAIVGTGITPAVQTALLATLDDIINQFPYRLGADGEIDATQPTFSLRHPSLDPAMQADPDAGTPATRFGGAAMPYIDWNEMTPSGLTMMLRLLHQLRDLVANAT